MGAVVASFHMVVHSPLPHNAVKLVADAWSGRHMHKACTKTTGRCMKLQANEGESCYDAGLT